MIISIILYTFESNALHGKILCSGTHHSILSLYDIVVSQVLGDKTHVNTDLAGCVAATMSLFFPSRNMEHDQPADVALPFGYSSDARTPNTLKEVLKTTGVNVMPSCCHEGNNVMLTTLPVVSTERQTYHSMVAS